MSYLSELGSAIRRGFCQVTRTADALWDLVKDAAVAVADGVGGNTLTDAHAQFLNNLRRASCNSNVNTDANDPNFSGGQCPVLYNVTCTVELRVNNPTAQWEVQTDTIQVWGKVKRLQYSLENNRQFLRVIGGQPGNPDAEVGVTFISFAADTQYRNEAILSVVRADGQPDTCGDLPRTFNPPPPNYNHYDTDIVFYDNDGVEINVPVTLVFGFAYIDADFQLQVPVTIQLSPEFNFQGTLNIGTGDINYDFTGNIDVDINGDTTFTGGNNDNRTTNNTNNYNFDTRPPSPPPNADSDDVDEPDEPEQERLIRGAIVTVTQLSGTKESVIYQQNNPDIYAPNLGFIQFKIRIKDVVSWTSDQPVKSLRSFIPCTWDGGAIDVQGTPSHGVQFTITPVYGLV